MSEQKDGGANFWEKTGGVGVPGVIIEAAKAGKINEKDFSEVVSLWGEANYPRGVRPLLEDTKLERLRELLSNAGVDDAKIHQLFNLAENI